MPKLRKETENEIKRLVDEGYTNVEIAEKLNVYRDTVSKHRPEEGDEKEKSTEEEDSPEGGPMKITGLEDSYSSRLKKKFQTIRRWIQGEPVGVDPTSKGSSYLLKRVKETPEVMDDYRRLIKWIDQSTGAKEMSVEEVVSDLMEIDQEQGKRKITPGFGPGLEEEEGSEAKEELAEAQKKRTEIREEIEKEALDRLKDRRPVEKIGNALENAGFYKHLGTILVNKVAHPGKSLAEGLLELEPSDRREIMKDFLAAQSEISKSGSAEGEGEGGSEKESVSEEISRKTERARQRLKEKEEESGGEEEGEEEIMEEIPP